MITRIQAYFVPPSSHESEEPWRSTALVMIALILCSIGLLTAAVVTITGPRSPLLISYTLIGSLAVGAAPFLLRFTASRPLASVYLLTTIVLTICAVAFMPGGGTSATTPWISVLPVIAVILLRSQSAKWALLMSMVTLLIVGLGPRVLDNTITLTPVISLVSIGGLTVFLALTVGGVDSLRAQALAAFSKALTQLQVANDGLESARARAAAAERAQQVFLAQLNHDVRGPARALLGVTELLRADVLTNEQAEWVKQAEQAATDILKRVDDLLAFSDIPGGPGRCLPRGLVEHLTRQHASSASARGLEVVARVAADVPEAVVADEGRIARALDKLAQNAVAYTKVGRVDISVDVQPDGRLRFAVRDTGPGIAPERLQALLHEPHRDPASGELGLMIAGRLVRQLGGRLEASSAAGAGSAFWFEVTAPALPGAEANATQSRLDGARILLVNDEPISRRVGRALLEAAGATVDAVGTAAGALHRLADGRAKRYQVAILDMITSDRTGLELAVSIRDGLGLLEFPLILATSSTATGQATVRQETQAAELNISHLLRRPVRTELLIQCVSDCIAFATVYDPDVAADERGATILIADDNAVNRKIAVRQLEQRGFRATSVDSGEDAVARHAEVGFDAILMDCRMPGMSGVEAARTIRASAVRPDIPILAITASPHPDNEVECARAGMNAYLLKPTRFDEVETLLGQHEVYGHRTRATADVLVLNPQQLHAFVEDDDDRRFVSGLITDYLDRFGTTPDRLAKALEHGEFGEAREEAHALAGSSATLGLERVTRAARSLERACVCLDSAAGARELDRLGAAMKESTPVIHEERTALMSDVSSREAG